MNAAVRFMLFSIVLNFATGLMFNILPLAGSVPVLSDENYSADFIASYRGDVDIPTNTPSGFLNSLFDFVSFGWFSKLGTLADQYMFGFVNFLEGIFGAWIAPSSANIIFNGIKAVLSVSYAILAIWLFTGRKITGQ